MTKIVLMLVYFGSGQSQVYTVAVFDSLAECETGKTKIVEYYKDKWSGPSASDITCLEIN